MTSDFNKEKILISSIFNIDVKHFWTFLKKSVTNEKIHYVYQYPMIRDLQDKFLSKMFHSYFKIWLLPSENYSYITNYVPIIVLDVGKLTTKFFAQR